MGREVRKVPKDWKHPKEHDGSYIPLFGRSHAAELAQWQKDRYAWVERLDPDLEAKGLYDKYTFEEWDGPAPDPVHYMPNWPEEERTHYVMYEDTSEGTPLTPGFKTIEELARWCADHGVSAFGSMTATYEQWLATCKKGCAPSLIIQGGKMRSGVEVSEQRTREPDTDDA